MCPERIKILGVPVDCVDMESSIDVASDLISKRAPSSIFAVNPEKVVAARSNALLRTALENSALLIPDGIGVVAAARILHGRSFARVAGAELMPRLCEQAARYGWGVFLLGAAPGVADRASRNLLVKYPDLRIVGAQHGYFGEDEVERVKAQIRAAKPEILFVAFGSPRQELWIDRHLADLGPVLAQAVGGTFDVIAGHVTRAPAFFRDNHLEWFYRLASNPSRLARQKALPVFLASVMSDAMRSYTRSGPRRMK